MSEPKPDALTAQIVAELHARTAEIEAWVAGLGAEIAGLKAEIDDLRKLLSALDAMKKLRGERRSKRLGGVRLTLVPRE